MALICLLFRKPTLYFFSIENVFDRLVAAMATDRLRIAKVTVPHYSSSPRNIIGNLLFGKKQKADIFHVTGDVHYLVACLPRNRTVLTIHDCVFLNRPGGLKRSLLKWLFLQMPVRRCRLVTTISEATRQDILRETGCDPAKVIVIPNPVDDRIKYVGKAFNDAKPVILFIGSTPNKNLERVIEALEGIDCKLNIIGKLGELQLSLLEKHRIDFANRFNLPDEELIGQYQGSDMVLFPSTFEGFGLPIIEGQQMGRPVVTSDLSPMKEVAGEGACLVDPHDPGSIRRGVLAVIRDAAYRDGLVRNGLLNVQRYSAAAVAGQYENLYTTILTEIK
jgi:glycosyltransferase involved in cell wall biosynthesis